MTPRSDAKDEVTPATTTPALDQLYLYLTEGCNLACRHCWLAPKLDPHGDRYATLPLQLIRRAVEEAKPLGLRMVKLTGGEPLLHPRFEDVLGVIHEAGVRLAVETNGLLCTPRMADAISRFTDPHVSVSIDGVDAQTHDRIRGTAGSFEAACGAVSALVAAGVRPQIIFSVMRDNAGQVDVATLMAEELGAASIKFNVVQPTARGEQLHAAADALGVAELIALGRRVESEAARTARIPVCFDYPPAFRPLGRLAEGDSCGVCGIHGILGVIPSGHYALCGVGEHVPALVFGRVGRDSLELLWRTNTVLLSLREGLPDRLAGICSRCLMRQTCLGACVAQNYYSTGELWGPFWFCAQAAQAGVFPSSRLIPE